jgi:hypothetical protein
MTVALLWQTTIKLSGSIIKCLAAAISKNGH